MSSTPTLFMIFRRGIPLSGVALSLVAIWFHPVCLGWALIVAAALILETWTTFSTGGLSLSKRWSTVRWDGYLLRVLRPLFRLLKLEERWLLSFCAWNNQRVSRAFRTKRANKAIVLLPRCVQLSKCKASVVENIQSCFRCGKCVVEDAAQAALKYNWDVKIASRSHLAYLEARKSQPDIIIAIACSDRLVKGLLKLPEIPSYTIPLELPRGMCVDATFDFQYLSQAMSALAEPRPVSNIQP